MGRSATSAAGPSSRLPVTRCSSSGPIWRTGACDQRAAPEGGRAGPVFVGMLVLENEGDLHVHAVLHDLAPLDLQLLLLDPGPFHVLERLVRSIDSEPGGVLEALGG